MKITKCSKCHYDIKTQGYANHIRSCTGQGPKPKFVKLDTCPYCALQLNIFAKANRANHVRWCLENPKRELYVEASNASQMQTKNSREKSAAGIKQAWADGKYEHVDHSQFGGWKHSDETIAILRKKALASTHRRLVRSIRSYTKLDGSIVKLDSSWKEALAKRLDEIKINWTRPPAIKWIDDVGVSHNYFPDFYLIDYDLYLDPKNPYAIKAQQAKLECLTKQIKNLIIIKTLAECKNYNPL
jgi:hypothetical protein